LRAAGDCPCDRHCCPRATPRERASAVPASGTSVGAAPLRAGCGRCLCGLATGKHRPLWVGCGQALPLRPGYGEIVYPRISNSDGEDEGSQASSSLAVSTRWISTAKLFQSDLVTLAQRKGGE
ncbi:hypothetical protein GW17_00049715, partial [Ensete ventricosum]